METKLQLQSASLVGLEPTLIRNLTDHHGNNLLHAVCCHGHVNLLPWVTRRFANELNGALSDENRRGFTPIVYAIKVRGNNLDGFQCSKLYEDSEQAKRVPSFFCCGQGCGQHCCLQLLVSLSLLHK